MTWIGEAAFPKLYYEIERAVSVWRRRGHTISKSDIDISQRDDAAFTILLYDNQLSVTSNTTRWFRGGWRKRAISVLSQIHRAIDGAVTAGESVPNVEFAVTVGDMAVMPEYVTSFRWWKRLE